MNNRYLSKLLDLQESEILFNFLSLSSSSSILIQTIEFYHKSGLTQPPASIQIYPKPTLSFISLKFSHPSSPTIWRKYSYLGFRLPLCFPTTLFKIYLVQPPCLKVWLIYWFLLFFRLFFSTYSLFFNYFKNSIVCNSIHTFNL